MQGLNNIGGESWHIDAVTYSIYISFVKVHFRLDRQKLGFFTS